MSEMMQVKVKALGNLKINLEKFNSGIEMAEVSKNRPLRHSDDLRRPGALIRSFNGVDSYEEAEDLLMKGYRAAVEDFDVGKEVALSGVSKRCSFRNDVVGYAPVVPLALQGVPNCMINMRMKPIKAKVLDVYYDVGAIGDVSVSEIKSAGAKLLAAIMKLELSGYKFNLYALKSQYSSDNRSAGADMACIKIKNSNTPFDIQRMSFPLAHPAFFRCICWDWYSRNPHSIFRTGYGRSLAYDFKQSDLDAAFKELFGNNVVYLSCKEILKRGESYIKEVLTNEKPRH